MLLPLLVQNLGVVTPPIPAGENWIQLSAADGTWLGNEAVDGTWINNEAVSGNWVKEEEIT